MAKKIKLQSSEKVIPMIYAYTTPEIKRHEGWTKIGYTEQDVTERIQQQAHTIDVQVQEEWRGLAVFDDGSGERFTDKEFHRYLRKKDYKQEDGKNNEWFEISGPTSQKEFYTFKADRGILKALEDTISYQLRDEQADAVKRTKEYHDANANGEYLWNAKPRFGKTLSVYDLCKAIKAEKVLIVTNRPAIANSWYEDYVKFMGEQSGYKFISSTDALKDKKYVINRDEYINLLMMEKDYNFIEFVSLQDLKGSIYFGGKFDKLDYIADLEWDLLVIDEAHEGVDTYKTDVAFDHIKRKFTLHLSGTPFKALANEKFSDKAIYNWTYKDEQEAKRAHEGDENNPYFEMPKLNLYTYQMSEIIKDELKKGIEINDEDESYAFDLNEFFKTTNGKFDHDSSVDKFLDALASQEKFPFSTSELRQEIKHSFWLLNRVDSAKALAEKLNNHPLFNKYEVVLAAGDGRLSEDEQIQNSFNKVKDAIKNNEYTITLSVGQLTTGVTIPEWTAVLMLSNVNSPSLYMQAAFRAQNPCMFQIGNGFYRKENAYVFDFDPARTLKIFEEFANDLSSKTSRGKGTGEDRKENVKELLNFFPVIAEEDGEMVELDAEKVLVLPRKILSKEVVRCGFMSNLLFQNIANIFHASQEVIDIVSKMDVAKPPKKDLTTTTDTKDELHINEDGEVEISDDVAIGLEPEVFGDKIYQIVESIPTTTVDDSLDADEISKALEEARKNLQQVIVNELISTAKEQEYGSELKGQTEKKLENKLYGEADIAINKLSSEFNIKNNVLENEKQKEIDNATTSQEVKQIEKRYEKEKAKLVDEVNTKVVEVQKTFVEESAKTIIVAGETARSEKVKKTKEEEMRDHLRGFSRTIPSFLMAYGNENTTLSTFEQNIPANVFEEVTSITIDEFKLLRDENIFDAILFDDSVKEFLSTKERLANYFDDTAIEDIFDYIPPQKTNQIYTPKKVVIDMVDMLEKENPGCFDDDTKTFADLYMKSGLYIAEIVKRLFRSKKMKKKYPDDNERLKHIFANQVYGLAPTEIIFNIAKNFILGFDKEGIITDYNFKMCDSLPYAENGALESKLDELFDRE